MATYTFLSQAQCLRKIDQIARVGTVLQETIHNVAVNTLAHVRDHGDYTLAERLLNALPNGQRVKALAFWYSNFSAGKLSFTRVNGKWSGKLKTPRVAENFDVDGAAAVTFADLTSEKDPKAMSLDALLKYLARKAEDDSTFDNGQPKVHPEARAMAARLLAFAQAGPVMRATMTAEATEAVAVAAPAPPAAITADAGDDIANIVAELAA